MITDAKGKILSVRTLFSQVLLDKKSKEMFIKKVYADHIADHHFPPAFLQRKTKKKLQFR